MLHGLLHDHATAHESHVSERLVHVVAKQVHQHVDNGGHRYPHLSAEHSRLDSGPNDLFAKSDQIQTKFRLNSDKSLSQASACTTSTSPTTCLPEQRERLVGMTVRLGRAH